MPKNPEEEPDDDPAEAELNKPITFAEHRERTAADLDSFAETVARLAVAVREGNMEAFEQFWFQGGTEEGDAKIYRIREIMLLRYFHRRETIKEDAVPAET